MKIWKENQRREVYWLLPLVFLCFALWFSVKQKSYTEIARRTTEKIWEDKIRALILLDLSVNLYAIQKKVWLLTLAFLCACSVVLCETKISLKCRALRFFAVADPVNYPKFVRAVVMSLGAV